MSITPTTPYLQHSTVGRFFFHIVNYNHITFILVKVQVKTRANHGKSNDLTASLAIRTCRAFVNFMVSCRHLVDES